MDARIPLASAAFLVLSAAPLIAGSGGPDNFGYTWRDSASQSGPDYQWIDISQTGDTVVSGAEVVGTVRMEPPAVIYGGVMKEIAVSRHGYISNVPADTGTDSTNDCGLPVNPGGVPVGEDRPHRIYVTHDQLEFEQGGAVLHQFFPNSPHPNHPGGVHVITWKDVRHPGDPFRSKFSMQVLLFSNFDILMQFKGGIGSENNDGSTSTTGIQQNTLEAALEVACDTAGSISPNSAILFRPPVVTVTTAEDQNDSPAGPQVSLREAVRDSLGGTRIEFASSLDGDIFLLDHQLVVTGNAIGPDKAISLDAGAGERIILVSPLSNVGTGANHAIRCTAPLLHLHNAHFLNSDLGNVAPGVLLQGGGCLVASDCRFELHQDHAVRVSNGGAADLIDCEFLDNRTAASGGVSRFGGAVSVSGVVRATACSFDSNEAVRLPNAAEQARGGAVNCTTGIFVDCVFRANRAGSGGGAVYGNWIEATSCEFSSNTVDNTLGRGGAIEALVWAEAHSTIFENNRGGFQGGAVYCDGNSGGETRLINCALGNNEASLGGAAFVRDGSVLMDLTTLRANVGPAVYLGGASDGGDITNCAFEKNQNGSGSPESVVIAAGGVTPTGTYCVFDDAPVGLGGIGTMTNTAAGLSNARFYVPFSDSPLIDAGDPGFVNGPALDIRSYPRVSSGRVDIGCYESVGHVVVTTSVDEDVDPGTGKSLREALAEVVDGGLVTFKPSLDGAVINAVALHEIGVGVEVLADDLPNGITIDATGLDKAVRMLEGAEMVGVSVCNAVLTGVDAESGSRISDGVISNCRTGLLVRPHQGGNPTSASRMTITECGGPGTSAVVLGHGSRTILSGCEITDNISSGVNGGAILGGDDVVLDLVGCNLLRNETESGRGGAVYLEGNADLELVNCAVLDNLAEQNHGGGVYVGDGGHVRLRSTTIARNRSGGDGGGVYLAGECFLYARGATFSHNVADRSGAVCRGGAIRGSDSDFIGFYFCTIVGNHALTDGGGLAFGAGDSVTMESSILAGNTLGVGAAINHFGTGFTVGAVGRNLIDNGEIAGGEHLTNTAPLLGPLGYYGFGGLFLRPVHAPLAISPAIDAVLDANGAPQNIGAVSGGDGQARVVTSAANSGPGTLREAVAVSEDYDRILFAPELDGAILTLSETLTVSSSVQIDATTLPRGITLSGGDSIRVIDVEGLASLAMHAVSITGGLRGLGGATNWGSAVRLQDDATLTYSHGAMYENSTEAAGTIALRDRSQLVLSNATIAENYAGGGGGAIQMQPDTRARIEHSAIVNNDTGLTGPALGMSTGRVVAYSSIFANNHHTTGLRNFSTGNASNPFAIIFKSEGYNLTDPFQGAVIEAGLNATGDLRTADFSSSDLTFGGEHSGWCPTVQNANTGAIDAGDPRRRYLPIFDARGKTRVAGGRMDIGPLEDDGESWDSDGDGAPDWWENLYGFRVSSASDADDDPDGDGFDNLTEFENGTDPRVPDADGVEIAITSAEIDPDTGELVLVYETAPGVVFVIQVSVDLVGWIDFSTITAAGGANTSIRLPSSQTSGPRNFVRLMVLP